MGKARKENNMIKRKLLVAGMTAFAITTATGIAALASQGDANMNSKKSCQIFETGDNEMYGQGFDKADNKSDEKPVLPRKPDEEAMKEEIKETQEIANTDPTPYTLSIYICILQVE